MKILLVHNDKTDLEHLKGKLQQRGYQVIAVNTLAQVINLVRANYVIDVIITEQFLPECPGTDIVSMVGHRTPAYVLGARNWLLNFILKKRCFPNIVFTPVDHDPDVMWRKVREWLKSQQTLTTKTPERV